MYLLAPLISHLHFVKSFITLLCLDMISIILGKSRRFLKWFIFCFLYNLSLQMHSKILAVVSFRSGLGWLLFFIGCSTGWTYDYIRVGVGANKKQLKAIFWILLKWQKPDPGHLKFTNSDVAGSKGIIYSNPTEGIGIQLSKKRAPTPTRM